MSSASRFRFLPLLAAVALVVSSCDTMSGQKEVTRQKRVPASALAADCTAALPGSLQRADTTKGLTPAPMSGGELVCTEVTVTEVCLYDVETGENIECAVTEVKCTDWVYVQDPPDGGGGSDPPGDGEECCANPPCSDLCYQPPGGGSDPVPPPDTTTTTVVIPPANPNDVIEIPGDTLETFPDCGSGGLTGWEIDYCQSSLPDPTQELRIEDAFDRIEQRGEVCQKIAARGRLYLNAGILRIFPSPARAGGYGEVGLVMIHEAWVSHWYNQATEEHVDGELIRRNLDSVLSHEIDHVMGYGHIDPEGYLTPHSKQCSGLSY